MTTAAVPTTLAALMARTATDGNCRVWLGHCDSVGSPKITIHYQKYFVRRLVWQLLHGPIAKGGQIGATCGTPGCTAPAHLVCRTRSQALKGRPIPIERRIRIALTQRAKAATKLTPEQVAEIRASTEPANALDKRYGLSNGRASFIRRGLAWRDYANPFAGLVRP